LSIVVSFQFLIGTLQTHTLLHHGRAARKLQFLIGTLQTRPAILDAVQSLAEFQFLIGTLQTWFGLLFDYIVP